MQQKIFACGAPRPPTRRYIYLIIGMVKVKTSPWSSINIHLDVHMPWNKFFMDILNYFYSTYLFNFDFKGAAPFEIGKPTIEHWCLFGGTNYA
jgi:hypothetical protein